MWKCIKCKIFLQPAAKLLLSLLQWIFPVFTKSHRKRKLNIMFFSNWPHFLSVLHHPYSWSYSSGNIFNFSEKPTAVTSFQTADRSLHALHAIASLPLQGVHFTRNECLLQVSVSVHVQTSRCCLLETWQPTSFTPPPISCVFHSITKSVSARLMRMPQRVGSKQGPQCA